MNAEEKREGRLYKGHVENTCMWRERFSQWSKKFMLLLLKQLGFELALSEYFIGGFFFSFAIWGVLLNL